MADNSIQTTLRFNNKDYIVYNLNLLEGKIDTRISRIPFAARILMENLARNLGSRAVQWQDLVNAADFYGNGTAEAGLIAYFPARVLMQDFTGVPAVVDLASMRSAVALKGLDPEKINPLVPVDLVVDHSIQVDFYKEKNAHILNAKKEYERNKERYMLLKWAQENFDNFRVVPPESGICHQVNLEYLADVITIRKNAGGLTAFPDTLVGTDSHTTMINALGVLGWGVGGIEAEAVMLGQPYYMNLPEIVGVNFTGTPPAHTTSTDIALYVTHILRKEKVVEKIVEYTGTGLKSLSLTDRATIANMAPEYGATAGFFPVDENTLDYLNDTCREEAAGLVEAYCRACGFFNTYEDDIRFSKKIDVDLSRIESLVAGPSRPQDKLTLKELKPGTSDAFKLGTSDSITIHSPEKNAPKDEPALSNGSIVIAAITSCTNTSNPYTMIGAGLVARKALEKGLRVPWYVKTSLAPGSKVVIDYLEKAGLLTCLEQLGFNNAGFGCTTCIGNSGPLDPFIEKSIDENSLNVMSVLSGNRNFEARIHQKVKGNFLMSPILVVIFALAGKIDIDLETEAIGLSKTGEPVFMKDLWPDPDEINALIKSCVEKNFFKNQYSHIFQGDQMWHALETKKSTTFDFEKDSTYIQNPPFFENFSESLPETEDSYTARPLLILGDSVTTDHISPAGAIPKEYPAGRYLTAHGVEPLNFNSYGSRRGNHEVMMRGTFANIRIKNRLVSETGGLTLKFPEKTTEYVFDAAKKYEQEDTPLIVIGGKEYGTGSSRDWAAKGTTLLGVKAVIAQSFERIHRSNLVGMGVLPLTFKEGDSFETLGLSGDELFEISGLNSIQPNSMLTVTAKNEAISKEFNVNVKINNEIELDYLRNGGILPFVLRQIISRQ